MAFQNLEKILKEAGSGLEGSVELVTYHTSIKEIGGFSKICPGKLPSLDRSWSNRTGIARSPCGNQSHCNY
jgi:enamine deaminase RidA (YjgF/YER057c/UK114 family)